MVGALQYNTKNPIPETGFVRLAQIVGDVKQGIPPMIPVGKSAWYKGMAEGKYPRPIRLNGRTSVYKVEDIRALIERISNQQA